MEKQVRFKSTLPKGFSELKIDKIAIHNLIRLFIVRPYQYIGLAGCFFI